MAKLGDICNIQSGGTPSRSNKDYWDNGTIPWVKISDFSGKYLSQTSEKITQAGLDGSSAKIFPKGTILYTIFATLGETCILDIDATTNQAIAGVKLIDDSVSLDYLYYYLLSKKEYVNEIGRGVAQNNINMKILREMEIAIPPKEEQHKITDVLNKVYELIALRKEQLAKLDQLVKSRFIELFGDPFNNKKWDTQKLRNISVSISDGSNIDKAYYKEKGDVLFLRIQNVWFNEFRLDDSVYISDDVNNEYLDTSLHHGDLLITKIGRYYTKDSSLGRVSVYLGEDDKANYSNNIMRVRLTDEVCSEFVNALMNLDDYNRYIREVSVGGTDKRALSKAIIGDLPIIMPPKELQIEFLEFVKQTDKSKLAIQESLAELETLKKALMQKYFG